MALTAAQILTRVQDIIQDTTNVRWPAEELLRYLNDARREIAIARPDLYAITANLVLASGTKQAVPADGARFLDALRNVTAGGDPGRAVRVVERRVLDAQRPDWHTEAAGAIKHFMFDLRNPRVFYVYPPGVSGEQLEIVYSQNPVEITDTNTQLTNESIYTGAIVDYVCYRAFSKDEDYTQDIPRAAAHWQQFQTALAAGEVKNAAAVT